MSKIILTDSRVDVNIPEISLLSGKEIQENLLASQSGLRLRGLLGANRRVRRGPSLGDPTSAGAGNSQATLHTDNATATMTALLRKGCLTQPFPFSRSESSITK